MSQKILPGRVSRENVLTKVTWGKCLKCIVYPTQGHRQVVLLELKLILSISVGLENINTAHM